MKRTERKRMGVAEKWGEKQKRSYLSERKMEKKSELSPEPEDQPDSADEGGSGYGLYEQS